jgi:toxin ParE1/3/4
MASFRLARRAQADISRILATSGESWGIEARRRYAGLLTHAIREVAAEPEARSTRQRAELAPGMRSFHVRHAQQADPGIRVRRPVHVLYYRVIRPGLVEIVRVLHERMEPSRHLGTATEDEQ